MLTFLFLIISILSIPYVTGSGKRSLLLLLLFFSQNSITSDQFFFLHLQQIDDWSSQSGTSSFVHSSRMKMKNVFFWFD